MTALLLLHAFSLDGTMWDRQVAALRDEVDRILAPSLPGFGGTSLPASQPSLDDYADWLAAILDREGVDRAVVAGLSMGGYVAFALWRRHRSRVAALLLAGTRAEADDEPARDRRHALIAAVRERGIEAVVLQLSEPPVLRADSPHWEEVRGIVRAQPAEAAVQASIAMEARRDSRDLLASIDVPVAIVVGADDEKFAEASRSMAESIAGASLTVIPRAGHIANIDAPVEFNRALRDVVRRAAWSSSDSGQRL